MNKKQQAIVLAGILLFLPLFGQPLKAQKREIGFSLGSVYYTGDMAHSWKLANTGFAGMLMLRSNLNDHLSLRLTYTELM